jgi:hypothetical protein
LSYYHEAAAKNKKLLALLCAFKFLVWRLLVRASDCACMNAPDEIKEKKEELARAILHYLIKNQDAQDITKHIVKWWLFDQYQTKLVKEVLNKLAADGLVIAQQVSPSETLYKMNRRRRRQIMSLLQQSPKRSS